MFIHLYCIDTDIVLYVGGIFNCDTVCLCYLKIKRLIVSVTSWINVNSYPLTFPLTQNLTQNLRWSRSRISFLRFGYKWLKSNSLTNKCNVHEIFKHLSIHRYKNILYDHYFNCHCNVVNNVANTMSWTIPLQD